MSTQSDYVGRFAPSPSGPLHLGSLSTALGSYIQARVNKGKWLLRIDDLDTPRVAEGSIQQILESLESHGLHWDDSVVFQSNRSDLYSQTLTALSANKLTYRCECSRQQVKQAGQFYAGTCRVKATVSEPCAIRFVNKTSIQNFEDKLLGQLTVDPIAASEDFVLRRRDGLIAYHLASVADDIQMGVTEVVRGADLIVPTACQIALLKALEANLPSFRHLPLVTFSDGRKFSKQNHAPAIQDENAVDNLCSALRFLGFPVPSALTTGSVQSVIDWSLENWSLLTINTKNIKQ